MDDFPREREAQARGGEKGTRSRRFGERDGLERAEHAGTPGRGSRRCAGAERVGGNARGTPCAWKVECELRAPFAPE